MTRTSSIKITIIGLGYVGLPLAVEFSKLYKVIGYDIDVNRINSLNDGFDITNEVDFKNLPKLKNLIFTSDLNEIIDSNIYIITVPTPVDINKKPDLSILQNATRMVAKIIKKGDIIIYESTVYPGCTEEICVPILENFSLLKYNTDFFCGYSPERINPGDKVNTLTKIKKVTSGSTNDIAIFIDQLYSSIIIAGTHLAPSIKVAEASKAIENAQRDVNISFVNELALIFDRMDIDTNDVLAAASTKWNFLNFKPGLVGGHCIGVDPYYLASKSLELGYSPNVILSGRKVNESMGKFIVEKCVKLLIDNNFKINKSKALILGITFKENCPDIRNTRVIDIYRELIKLDMEVDFYDPIANSKNVFDEYNISLITKENLSNYDLIIYAVSHQDFLNIDLLNLKSSEKAIIYDVKGALPIKIVNARL